ncbi:nucleoporin complex subunit 54-domain-containing protein [Massariosphaeria phaeospora]|uniref:Nucleoporin complex subunit 54-domain-containing protein n=1 Tax=Massariosphaeria phaeospora TaxID=100035 RepID=A0A7C8MVY9_9PLEO|nr:nucleoporin complex subunit 54-domain-containing protein [Massariosphaeria phaeospora]
MPSFGVGTGFGAGEKKTGTLFGSTTAPPGGLFSQSQQPAAQSTTGLFGASAAPQQNTGLFGSSQVQNQGSNIFNQPQQQSQGSNIFNQPQQQNQGSNLFNQPQQQNQGSNMFNQPQQQQQQQPQMNNSIFGGMLQPTPALNQVQAQQLQQSQTVLPQLRQSLQAPFASTSMTAQREKSVVEQIRILSAKWNPKEIECVFDHYFYNSVKPEEAPFYGPQAHENERKWEEALGKKPNPGSIPVLARGFEDVMARVSYQHIAVSALRTRLHEINTSLTLMKNTHELNVASRITEAKRKHVVFTQRILALATKVQILRSRGYVMDQAEEELKKKLIELEKKTFDPVLGGRQEEIWARMSGVRERARILQEETEKLGKTVESQQSGELLSAEDQKQVEKLLKDYDRQLEHLKKWVDDTKQEYEDWEKDRKPAKSAAGGR